MLDCADDEVCSLLGWDVDGGDVVFAGGGEDCTAGMHRPKPLKVQIAKLLADPAVKRAHWGIAVTKMDGTADLFAERGAVLSACQQCEVVYHGGGDGLAGAADDLRDAVWSRSGVFDGTAKLTGDVVLIGGGDANLSGRVLPYLPPAERPVPRSACSGAAALSGADGGPGGGDRAEGGERRCGGRRHAVSVGALSADWTIDDAVWGYGAPVSALTINDNQIKVTVTPGDCRGQARDGDHRSGGALLHAGWLTVTTGAAGRAEACADRAAAGLEDAGRSYGSIARGCAAGCGGGGDSGSGGVCGDGAEGNARGAWHRGDGDGAGRASGTPMNSRAFSSRRTCRWTPVC